MIRKIIVLTALLICLATPALAEDFLAAPIMPGGQETARSAEELALTYDASPEAVVKYYQDLFAKTGDIKFRQRNGINRIEDYGNRPWHKIVITKEKNGKTLVTVTKDSWTWILGMLVLRFTGVFVVLLMLFIAMSIATRIIRWSTTAKAPAPAK